MNDQPRMCDIERALGLARVCPESDCPFYGEAGCLVAGLRADLGDKPDLARYLLSVRQSLGVAVRPVGVPAPGFDA